MDSPSNVESPRLWPAGTLPDLDSLERGLRAAKPQAKAVAKARALLDSDAVYDGDTLLRVAAAYRALVISPFCADAYLELAYLLQLELQEEKRLLRMAMAAAERALGPEVFKEDRGNFWGIMDTRPYMRARVQLADLAREEGDFRTAAAEYQDLIELSSNDNLGCRYSLLACLLHLGDREALLGVFARFPEDSPHMLYTRALDAFQHQGPGSKAAVDLARQGMKANKHVPKVLSMYDGYKYELDSYAVGQETEAMAYSDLYGDLWEATHGAIAWLLKTTRPPKPRSMASQLPSSAP